MRKSRSSAGTVVIPTAAGSGLGIEFRNLAGGLIQAAGGNAIGMETLLLKRREEPNTGIRARRGFQWYDGLVLLALCLRGPGFLFVLFLF